MRGGYGWDRHPEKSGHELKQVWKSEVGTEAGMMEECCKLGDVLMIAQPGSCTIQDHLPKSRATHNELDLSTLI